MAQNPVYLKMKAEADKLGRTPHLDTADAAKCIRATLKARFPSVKFSVRTSRYSGGSSVRVDWTDGPTDAMVTAICDRFEGKGFDGMIDLSYYKDIYLLPDGSAEYASSSGTEGSMGVRPAYSEWKPSPDAIRVSPSCYVFCQRSFSLEFMQRAIAGYARKFPGCPLAEAINSGKVGVRENKVWGGWEYFGDPYQIRDAVGDGRGYGGDVALRSFAARRMTAA